MKHRSFFRRFALLIMVYLCACQPVNAAEPTVAPTVTMEQPPRLTTAVAVPTVTPKRFSDPPAPSRTPTQAEDLPSSLAPSATATVSPEITLLFTGIIVPARCVQAALDANSNPDYPYEEVREIISQADLAIGTFNATMSHRVSHTGCVWTYQLVGSPQNADAMQRAGFDVMSVATNHIKDCGLMKSWCNETFFDTLDNLRRVGIQAVGAGKDLREALQPVVINVQGVRFAFVSLGDSKMDESVFATDDNPGIARLTQENMTAAVAAAKEAADVVIALPHWGSEDNFVPNWNQLTQAQQLVAAGADLIVGNHTHVVQAITEIDGVPVFYGLGNFVFDQWLRDHRQGVILLVKFQGARYLGYELIPTHVDQDGRVHIADETEAMEILENIERASQAIR
ncbi:MAG: CapA family protein [Anaerolineales bacterium]|nr:CapA family protein [Anaerolineales bacterium]